MHSLNGCPTIKLQFLQVCAYGHIIMRRYDICRQSGGFLALCHCRRRSTRMWTIACLRIACVWEEIRYDCAMVRSMRVRRSGGRRTTAWWIPFMTLDSWDEDWTRPCPRSDYAITPARYSFWNSSDSIMSNRKTWKESRSYSAIHSARDDGHPKVSTKLFFVSRLSNKKLTSRTRFFCSQMNKIYYRLRILSYSPSVLHR